MDKKEIFKKILAGEYIDFYTYYHAPQSVGLEKIRQILIYELLENGAIKMESQNRHIISFGILYKFCIKYKADSVNSRRNPIYVETNDVLTWDKANKKILTIHTITNYKDVHSIDENEITRRDTSLMYKGVV